MKITFKRTLWDNSCRSARYPQAHPAGPLFRLGASLRHRVTTFLMAENGKQTKKKTTTTNQTKPKLGARGRTNTLTTSRSRGWQIFRDKQNPSEQWGNQLVCMFVCACASVCVCICACVRACVRACVGVRVEGRDRAPNWPLQPATSTHGARTQPHSAAWEWREINKIV